MEDTSFKKTKQKLNDYSSTESIESNAATDESPPGGEAEVHSLPHTASYTRRERMMPPEEKLGYFESRAQAMADSQQFDACISDLVRCVALARLAHGERHLKLAQAQVRLAEAYLQFKGWGAQAQKHSSLAMDLLLSHPAPICSDEDGPLVFTWLLRSGLVQGGASMLTGNLKEAEASFLNTGRILEECYLQGGVDQEERSKTELKISTALSRLYQRQRRPLEALAQCERSLQLLGDRGDPGETCSVYRDMAAIEESRGSLDRAVEHLTKAHAIAVSQSPGGLDRAHIAHKLAVVHSSAAGPRHNESAALYFEESLDVYRDAAGTQDPTFLTAQDDYCRFLLIDGQMERCVEVQKASLAPKRYVFGEWSAEVADSIQLIGGVQMTQGLIRPAHRTLRKCLEIQNIIFGPQHKKTKATQKTVDMLARAPEVVNRQLRRSTAVS
ncbi:tetratricopeptide repeat protein 23 isoform X1 [Gadus morhua]|uniref:tetratricopeptide repeat protein 23 isoform X1 n=2 Tax=Gadus morhua TaxID=8049 RepID=UPI0011B64FDF|nr:tetratricopeptide repeat protein 23 isoform X1 [Gadus morhua]